VLPVSQPVCTQTFGPWEIATLANDFYEYETAGGFHALATSGRFLIKHQGNRVTIDGTSEYGDSLRVRFDRAESVALLPRDDALLVHAATELDTGPIYLVVSRGDLVRVELVSQGMPLSDVPPVTNDAARFHRARHAHVAPGTIDRTTFAEPGVYYFHDALVTTDPPAVRRFTTPSEVTLDVNARPLGLSPDGRTFVRLSYSYAFGVVGRMAMQAYLGTVGRDKVGFTVDGSNADGTPRLVGGTRGVVERNTMRYFLAIEAYLGALSLPPPERMEKSLRDWFAGSERYPRQLHEMGEAEYLAMKRGEVSRQRAG